MWHLQREMSLLNAVAFGVLILFSSHVPITVVTVSHLPERLFFIIKYCLTRFVQRFSMCSDVRVGFVSSLSQFYCPVQ